MLIINHVTKKSLFVLAFLLGSSLVFSQKAYFIDGYHGGVWGHFPEWNTRFMADQLVKNPAWKINIEIEPDTWDTAMVKDLAAYNDFKALFADQSVNGRIEYVNPAYGQSYMYNISGESIIRQFYYGMKKVREHFPTALFTSYSSEEPCFTSALPQILTSYGYQYASLKNPNTCWGGYTRAFGGELVNWVGPDNTKLVTVPRYKIEALQPSSTWQTIASNNSKEYIGAALAAGIKNPVGMCLQDAGWKGGPWLGDGKNSYSPTEYQTWRGYVSNASIKIPTEDWNVSQEDMQVSLVWGSQILQKLAQQVRVAENKLVLAEKVAAMASVYDKLPWPEKAFELAWRPLLLAQHHDCWIVPYNRKYNTNWAGFVKIWTDIAGHKSDSIMKESAGGKAGATGNYMRVYNGSGTKRTELVTMALPDNIGSDLKVMDSRKKETPSRVIMNTVSGKNELEFKAEVPAGGYTTYQLVKGKGMAASGAKVSKGVDGKYIMESDLYSITVDPAKGGIITSLVAKNMGNEEFVDRQNPRSFNELRGNFFKDGGFRSSTDQPATVKILEEGGQKIRLAVNGTIAGHPFSQVIGLTQGQSRIDLSVKIDWIGNPGIGNAYAQNVPWDAKDYHKAFYDDRDKLLVLFPANLKSEKVYVNAPFDVTESRNENTFFDRWDSIKNNILLNWVDVADGSGNFGLAVFSDHTTNYAHGSNHPLGLTLQYSGMGLWGRNYSITGPLEVSYSLLPHKGKWDNGSVWTESEKWNEPMYVKMLDANPAASEMEKSMVEIQAKGFQLSSIRSEGSDLLVRIFNAEGTSAPVKVSFDIPFNKAGLTELNDKKREDLKVVKQGSRSVVELSMPRFGFRTIRLSGVGKN